MNILHRFNLLTALMVNRDVEKKLKAEVRGLRKELRKQEYQLQCARDDIRRAERELYSGGDQDEYAL